MDRSQRTRSWLPVREAIVDPPWQLYLSDCRTPADPKLVVRRSIPEKIVANDYEKLWSPFRAYVGNSEGVKDKKGNIYIRQN